MLTSTAPGTVKVSEVKSHADKFLVADGQVRAEGFLGKNHADTAADLGRLRQTESVIDAHRAVLQVRRQWHPTVMDLQKKKSRCLAWSWIMVMEGRHLMLWYGKKPWFFWAPFPLVLLTPGYAALMSDIG